MVENKKFTLSEWIFLCYAILNLYEIKGNQPMERPDLTKYLDHNIFSQFYYLKSELVVFCRKEDMQTTGNKQELTERISHYLFCGEKLKQPKKKIFYNKVEHISLESKIESPFVCSEVHRKFYKDITDNSFSFIVPFQKWLKQNTGKTYQDSIAAYYQILIEKKNSPKKIDVPFEYNTYVRDFFSIPRIQH